MGASFEGGELEVFVGTHAAAGVGLTLTRASDVLIVERDWTPANEEQSEDRAHRIGQANAVTAYYLVSDTDIDEVFAGLVEAKREISRRVLDGAAGAVAEGSLAMELVRRLAGVDRADADAADEARVASRVAARFEEVAYGR